MGCGFPSTTHSPSPSAVTQGSDCCCNIPISLIDPDFGEQTAQACANACLQQFPPSSERLLQLRVLCLGFFEDGDIGVGVFPEGEEILVGSFRFGGVTGEGIRAGELEMGERTEQEILHDSGMIEELLKFRSCRRTIPLREVSQSANVRADTLGC